MVDAEIKTPAELLKNLNFDAMAVDTMVAKAYIVKHNGVFRPLYPTEVPIEQFDFDNYGNKIFYFVGKNTDKLIYLQPSTPYSLDGKKFKEIARKVEDNAKLFTQLEYLLRNTNSEDVNKYDIDIVSKAFDYYADTPCRTLTETDGNLVPIPVVITQMMPLAALGVVAHVLHGGQSVEIICDLDTAVIGHLFVTLCHEAGFAKDHVLFTPTKQVKKAHDVYSVWDSIIEPAQIKGAVNGSVVVVTEKSDLDSVVESVVASTHNYKYPWRLRRVIVQETVYELFQKALMRKTDQNPVTSLDDQLLASVKAKSAEVHITNEKIFLFDYADTDDNIHNEKPVVYVDGYRTTKELLSLLKKHRPSYLSVWCNDVSVKDEIVFGTDARHIWINDFGVFDDPKEIGYSLFAEPDFSKKYPLKFNKTPSPLWHPEFMDAIPKVTKRREDWIKKDLIQRREAIKRAMVNYKVKTKKNDRFDKLSDDINIAATLWKPESYAKFKNGTLTIGLFENVGILTLSFTETRSLEYRLVEIIKSILNGNGIIIPKIPIRFDQSRFIERMLDLLEEEDVPIVQTVPLDRKDANVEGVDLHYEPYVFSGEVLYKRKVIKSKFGETFAN